MDESSDSRSTNESIHIVSCSCFCFFPSSIIFRLLFIVYLVDLFTDFLTIFVLKLTLLSDLFCIPIQNVDDGC